MKIKQTELNCLDKRELSKLMKKVSNDVATVIASTYGPYGANTLIQTANSIHATKDGWTVSQHLNYPDNGVLNALKSLIMDCAQSVLLKFGDGTSTVMLLANQIYIQICETFILSGETYNIKTIENALMTIVNDICAHIEENGNPIDTQTYEGRCAIKNIARISTNWDEEMSDFISEIYAKTDNPIIKFENSGTDKSYVEYIGGYEIKGGLQLPQDYITDHTMGECVLESPIVMMFDYAIDVDKIELFSTISSVLQTSNRTDPLLIIAPDFRPKFLNTLNSLNMERNRRGVGALPCIPFKYYIHSKTDKDCINDLCHLFGTDMISETNTNIAEMFSDLDAAVRDKITLSKMKTPDEQDVKEVNERCSTLFGAASEYLLTISGSCESVTLDKKHLIAKNFTKPNEKIIDQRREDLKHEIDIATKECAALSMITEEIRMKRIRLGKLQLNMGVIHVGGFGDVNLKGKRDALDDATKACEAAFQFGYTVGGGVAGLIALNKCNDYKYEFQIKLKDIIDQSYREVIRILYNNKFGKPIDDHDATKLTNEIIDECIEKKLGYDIIKEQFSSELVSPVNGEIEILKGTMTLVIAMINANQMVFQDIRSIEDVERLAAIEECGDVTIGVKTALLKHQKKQG